MLASYDHVDVLSSVSVAMGVSLAARLSARNCMTLILLSVRPILSAVSRKERLSRKRQIGPPGPAQAGPGGCPALVLPLCCYVQRGLLHQRDLPSQFPTGLLVSLLPHDSGCASSRQW